MTHGTRSVFTLATEADARTLTRDLRAHGWDATYTLTHGTVPGLTPPRYRVLTAAPFGVVYVLASTACLAGFEHA